ncbi:MAG: hypothetical protein OEM79_02840 [Nitrosopumilus sp.]|nr:hypothetical protein [Nitrosopumilus sp.]
MVPISREIQIFTKTCCGVNKKILIMLIVAGIGLPIQMIISSLYPASEYSFALGLALAIFGVLIAIEIVLYSKVRKEIS